MNLNTAELPVPELPSPLVGQPTTPPPRLDLTTEELAILQSALPEAAKTRQADCLAWWRELPRFLAEGHAGRFALVEGGRVVSLWDTHNDAIQAGYDKFGSDRPFMTPKIEQRDLEQLRQFLLQERAKRCPN